MTQSDFEEFLATRDKLLARCAAIITKAPYWSLADIINFRFAFLVLDSERQVATVSWPYAVGGEYDSNAWLDTCKVDFPSYLLFLPEADLIEWKARETAKYEQHRSEQIAAQEELKVIKRREIYDTLKKEFETCSSTVL